MSLSESRVAQFKRITTTGEAAPPDPEDNPKDFTGRGMGRTAAEREIRLVGMLSAGMVDMATSLTLLRDTPVGNRDSHYDTLRRMHQALFPEKHLPLRWRYLSPKNDMGITKAEMEEDDVMFALNSSTSWADGEHAATAELLATTAGSLALPRVDSSDFSDGMLRPPVVLALIKGDGRGRMLANAVVDEIAVDLEADVVHLSAHFLARLLSRYMGQNAPAAPGSLAMAGYVAAETNGRLISRSAAEDSESPLKVMSVSLRSLLPSGGSSSLSLNNLRDGLSGIGGAADGRWEEMKLSAALEAIFEAAETKRATAASTGGSSDVAVAREINENNEKKENTVHNTNNNNSSHNSSGNNKNNLIIHLHDYVELSRSHASLVQKIRILVDRMWRAGKNITLVGSSAGDLDRHAPWRAELDDLGNAGARVIPFATPGCDRDVSNEEWSSVHENLANIEAMLRGAVGDDEVPVNGFVAEYLDAVKKEANATTWTALPNIDLVRMRLTPGVLDAQWVRRLVSIMVSTGPREGSSEQQKPQEQPQDQQQLKPQQQPQPRQYTLTSLADALAFMTTADWHWRKSDPKIAGPYFSPLAVTPRDATLSSIPFGSHHHDEDDRHHSAALKNLTGAAAKHEYKPEERKLLSGLINAKDIHTTFDQIVVPPETKESLVGLTTLSLLRPEAFAYGVLKTEHIPGCLLYGPPGTGKTLLAKAVAKESGASVLEVSAADINDKWVGQSEKNVQALFSLARKLAPCVIFLDEADALLAARQSSASARSAHRETITQFLREWDGLTGSRAFIMVATNRPFDLDEAVLRRLPRKILVDLPLAPEREAILRVILRDESLSPDIDLARLAADTPLYSGSDLKNVCVSAAMEAVREEVRARDAWKGEEPFQFPERRVLTPAHFAKGLRDISASISGDMDSLKAIRKFDEKYGDSGRGRNKRKGIGFGVVEEGAKAGDATREARVRKALA
ncbi:hypothetical protein B0J18DRAFT_431858 [Chaetomium sp. MPI-SDFR-AT-0129]|nr:hypothetical protein B0J18DRAFT_431858 [Chaetomium sp. MPI-SDFR-AT-0129]